MLELTLTHMSIACLEIVFIDNSYMRMSYNMYNNFNNIIIFTAGTQDNYVFGRKKNTTSSLSPGCVSCTGDGIECSSSCSTGSPLAFKILQCSLI